MLSIVFSAAIVDILLVLMMFSAVVSLVPVYVLCVLNREKEIERIQNIPTIVTEFKGTPKRSAISRLVLSETSS